MKAPTCQTCGSEHWRNQPCRFGPNNRSPAAEKKPAACHTCAVLKARVIEMESEISALRKAAKDPAHQCGRDGCAEYIEGRKKYCSDACRVAANRAKHKGLEEIQAAK